MDSQFLRVGNASEMPIGGKSLVLSQTVEYALRAIVCLANESPNPVTTEQLAEITKVPAAYLSKVMQGLNRAGLVSSQRGPNGGLTLAADPEELSLLDVVNAVDPIQRIHQCPLGIHEHKGQLCPLHTKLDETLAATETTFRETCLADLLTGSTGVRPLCGSTADDGKRASRKR
jgi:Rrf2 family protein